MNDMKLSAEAIISRANLPSGGRGVITAIDVAETRAAAIRSNKDYNDQAKHRLIAEDVSAPLDAQLTRLADADEAAATRELNQMEAEARKALLPEITVASAYSTDAEKFLAKLLTEQALARRQAMLDDEVAVIHESTDVDEIVETSLDVASYSDPHSTRKAFRAAVRRLEALHAATPELQRPAVFRALVQSQDRLKAHQAAHPTPRQALAAIEAQRGAAALRVRSTYDNIRQLAKLTGPQPYNVDKRKADLVIAASQGA